jgi:phospholipid/cholesterol/gamma-HCH transport system ATP-binding protein
MSEGSEQPLAAGAAAGQDLTRDPIRLDHVGLSFGDFVALSDVSFRVRRGEIAVIIGGSGAGKTTLGRLIVGLLRPTSGAVYVDGEDLAKMSRQRLSEARSKLGMVFQYSALLDSMTVLENVALPLKEHEQLSRKQIKEQVLALLETLDLAESDNLYPSELSGGMRKRVALARALIRRPSILVYDEPASGLDPLSARKVDELILRTREHFHVTSVVISHDMAQAFRLADYMHVLDKGRLVASGPPLELKCQPDSLAAQYFEASRTG